MCIPTYPGVCEQARHSLCQALDQKGARERKQALDPSLASLHLPRAWNRLPYIYPGRELLTFVYNLRVIMADN